MVARRLVLSIVLGVLLVLLLRNAWWRGRRGHLAGGAPAGTPRLESNQHTENRSDEPVVQLDVENMPLGQLVRQLTDRMKLNVVVYWPALAEENLTPETPISAHLQNVPVAVALADILYTASEGRIEGCSVQDGIINIPAWGGRYPYECETRIYDIRGLLDDYVRLDRQMPLDPPTTQPTDPCRRAVLAYSRRLERMCDFAGFESYDELSGRMIVTAPHHQQTKVAEFLRGLQHPVPIRKAGDPEHLK